MAVEEIDYIYFETRNFGNSARFWQQLGYELVLDLGTAGRLEPIGGGGGIFLEEVSPEIPLATGVYLKVADPSMDVDPAIEKVGDVVATHWGTKLQTIRDPGRSGARPPAYAGVGHDRNVALPREKVAG